MSLYVGTSASDYGLKTSGLIDHNSAYTWMAWVDMDSVTGAYGHIFATLGDNTDTYLNADWIGTDAGGGAIRLGAYSGGSGADSVGSDIPNDTPTHLALVRESSTSLKAFLNGTQTGSTVTTNVSGRASTLRNRSDHCIHTHARYI